MALTAMTTTQLGRNTDPTNIVVVTFLAEQQLTHYQSTKAGSVPAVQPT
jgi:hypothetical protein